jgi:HSP20 family protein
LKPLTKKQEPNMNTTTKAMPATSDRTTPEKEYVSPEVNIFETNDGYVLEAEMPGVNRQGLEISLEGNELTIRGHRADGNVNGDTLFRECRKADYLRVFELDPAIDTAKISAKMDQGVLTLTLPKSEKVKPRTIPVD